MLEESRAENGVQCGLRGDFHKAVQFDFIKKVTFERMLKEVRVTKWLSGGRTPQEEENRQCILTINFQMNEPTHFRNTKVLTSLINVGECSKYGC